VPPERLVDLAHHVLGHFELGPVLGKGVHSVVFRARDVKDNNVVALTVFSPEFPQRDEELQHFVHAMKPLPKLSHPHLVLMHAHVVPANVMIRLSDKLVKLADLLVSQALAGSRLQLARQKAQYVVELPYQAPEQTYPDAFVDSLSDVYGLGAIVYARLASRPPFTGATPEETLHLIRHGSLVKPSHYQESIPEALEKAVVRMLARHQEDRYQTMREVVTDLETIAEEEDVEL
jgi:serine/threonine protein kinase